MVTDKDDQRNNVLIKALELYMDHIKIQYRRAEVVLMALHQSDPYSQEEGENTPAGKLKKYRLTRKAPKRHWEKISKNLTLV